jgi:hypothetical protein
MPTVAINPPKTPVTAGSKGIAVATIPNVCKMPGPPAPFVPIPLPNIGKSDNSPSGYSTSVTIEGQAVAIKGASFKSIGDIGSQGTGGGIVSSTTQGATQFVAPGSMDVTIEGKNVQLLGDAMVNNSSNPANAATTPGEVQGPKVVPPGKPMPVECEHAFPSRPANKCEKQEICSKCKTINEQKSTMERLQGAAKTKAQKARDAECRRLNALGKSNPAKAGEIGFAAQTEECVSQAKADCEKTGFEGYSADHVVDVTLNGSATAASNLKWMSSKANSWMGSVMQHYDPAKHDGVAPDCC